MSISAKPVHIAAGLCLLLNACTLGSQPNAFHASREEIVAEVKTIAVLPITFERGLTAPATFHDLVMDTLVERFEAAGFETIVAENPPSDQAVDAYLQPSVVVTKADWGELWATWHGVMAPVGGGSERGYWAGWTQGGGAPGYEGTVGATSLRVLISNPDGRPYYDQYGGIELLSHVRRAYRFEPVPLDQLFLNAEHNETAVRLAIEDLVGGWEIEPQSGPSLSQEH